MNVVDRFTRDCLVIEVDTSITGRRVVAEFALLVAMRSKPKSILVKNGPGFVSAALDAWACEQLTSYRRNVWLPRRTPSPLGLPCPR